MVIDPKPKPETEDLMIGRRDEIAAHIAEGFAQTQRGELIDGGSVPEILRQRRAERSKPE